MRSIQIVMNAPDQWFIRRGTTVVGPVSMLLLLRGIQAGKIPQDSEARRADEAGWRNLVDVVVAVALALLEQPEDAELLDDLTDEEKTLITESPFVHVEPPAPVAPAGTPPVRPRSPRR
jgi:hypothetical protein